MADITLTIKCSNADKLTVSIPVSATVLELKEKIGEQLSISASQQRLIYKGKVLKDELTLEHYEVQDGHTVHMVKGSAPGASTPSTSSTAAAAQPAPSSAPSASTNPQANPFNMFGASPNPFAAMGGMGGAGAGGMPDVNRMQEQLMRNPEVMQQIMNSPMMDSLLNNPELMRNMMLNNPQMQQMLDSNPHIRHVLNDPAVS
jgi:ubiquilin